MTPHNLQTGEPIVMFGPLPPPPPNLQKMIAHFAGYHKIPLAVWAAFDDAMADWKARLRDRMLCREHAERLTQ